MNNVKVMKAWELIMKGYSTEEVASHLMLQFGLHYPKAKVIAMKGYNMAMPDPMAVNSN